MWIMQCHLVARHYICELCNAMLFSQASYMWIISCRPFFVFLIAFVYNVCIFNSSSYASAIWIGDGNIWSENKVFRDDNATSWSRYLVGYRWLLIGGSREIWPVLLSPWGVCSNLAGLYYSYNAYVVLQCLVFTSYTQYWMPSP